MRTNFLCILTVFFVLISLNLSAQTSANDTTSSRAIINRGTALHDEGKYDEAIKLYNSINKCDPSYALACYETALSYFDQGKTNEAYAKAKEADDLEPGSINTVSLIGSLMDDMGQTNEAVSYLEAALKKWPYNQNLHYNLAVCYIRLEAYEKAEDILMKSIRINLYHKSSHMALAKANFAMGRTAQSYLGFNMALLLFPRVNYIVEFENYIAGKKDTLSHPYKYAYPDGMNHKKWDELSKLMRTEIAFNDNFENPYNINYMTVRQSLLLFRKIQFDESDTSLYNQLYVRFFSDVMKRNDFETFINYCYKNTDDKKVAEWMAKNEKKIDAFVEWAQMQFRSYRVYGFSTANEARGVKVRQYNDEGTLEAIGTLKTSPTDTKTGNWLTLDSDGGIDESGAYTDNKLEGDWKLYWPDGKVRQDLKFKQGELDGLIKTYYSNSYLSGTYELKDGKREGFGIEYLSDGSLLSKALYRNDEMEGEFYQLWFADGYSQITNYVAGKREGKYTETWINGKPKTEAVYSNNNYNGAYKTWFATGKLETDGLYKEGEYAGVWKVYFPDGTISVTGGYDENGKLQGKKTNYYRNGKIQSEESEYTAGVLNGEIKSYFESGKIKSILSIKEDKPYKLESFDEAGTVLYTSEAKNDILHFKTFYANGNLEMEGDLKKGERNGKWAIYDVLGRIASAFNYTDGLQNGEQKTFYENGKLKEIYSSDSNYIVGLYKEFYANGHLKTHGEFTKVGRIGVWTTYFSNDTVESVSYFDENKKTGRNMFFSPAGKLTMEDFLDSDGMLKRQKLYSPDGLVLNDQAFTFDSTTYVSKYPSGAVKEKNKIIHKTTHGLSLGYYPNGIKKSEFNYVHGVPDGKWKFWDYKGNLSFEYTYSAGSLTGAITSYRDGKLYYTDTLESGLSQGVFTEYYPSGKPTRTITSNADKKHGNYDIFAPDGQLMYRLVFCEDVLFAYTYKDAAGKMLPLKPITLTMNAIQCYYPSGKMSCEIPLANGCYHGILKTFYPDGKPMAEKGFKNDELEGSVRTYYANGTLKEVQNYYNDENQGPYEYYHENGKLRLSGQHLAGKKDGEWKEYDQTGKLVNTLYYCNDEIYDIK